MATTWILTSLGTTGLTVTLNIYDLSDNSLAITSGAMTEIASTGAYKYSFTAQDISKDYFFQATGSDGTVVSGIVDPNNDIKKSLWNKKTLVGSSDDMQEKLYDDDGTTVIRTHNITNSSNVQLREGIPNSTHLVYWGKSSLTTLTEDQIEALTSNSLEYDKVRQYDMASGAAEYMWICWKAEFGKQETTKFIDNSTSLSIGFEDPITVSVTNGADTSNYYAYRSTATETSAKNIDVLDEEIDF